MSSSQTDEIKDRLNLTEVVQGYVKLQKAGKNWKGNCPFHSEKTPSFFVSPDKDMWYCFGCSEGGDLFTFIERIEGVEFGEALEMLAGKAGVELKKEDPKVRSRRQQLHDIVEVATEFFQEQLSSSSVGKKAMAYLEKRGVTPETAKRWRLGYAPDEWRVLHSFLRSKRYSEKALEAAGLTIKSEKKTAHNPYHDRFRHRIMFPVPDVQGNTVGFAGRVFEEVKGKTVGEDAGKYINTPNTIIYDKSGVLYGLSEAKIAIKKAGYAVAVEGNLDVILAHQSGTKNVVATSGTALASRHLGIIKRYTDKLVLAFDGDEAGERASVKGAQLAGSMGLNVSIAVLPEDKDVADIAQKDPKKWKETVKDSVPFVKFVIEKSKGKNDPSSLEGKKIISSSVIEAIASLSSPVEQEHWLGELSGVIGTSERALQQELETAKKDRTRHFAGAEKDEKIEKLKEKSGNLTLDHYFLAILSGYPKGVERLGEELDIIESEEVKSILNKASKNKVGLDKLLSKDKKFVHVLAYASFLDETVENKEDEFDRILHFLKRRSVKEKLKNIEQDIKRAEQSQDSNKVKLLLGKFNNLSKELLHYE